MDSETALKKFTELRAAKGAQSQNTGENLSMLQSLKLWFERQDKLPANHVFKKLGKADELRKAEPGQEDPVHVAAMPGVMLPDESAKAMRPPPRDVAEGEMGIPSNVHDDHHGPSYWMVYHMPQSARKLWFKVNAASEHVEEVGIHDQP